MAGIVGRAAWLAWLGQTARGQFYRAGCLPALRGLDLAAREPGGGCEVEISESADFAHSLTRSFADVNAQSALQAHTALSPFRKSEHSQAAATGPSLSHCNGRGRGWVRAKGCAITPVWSATNSFGACKHQHKSFFGFNDGHSRLRHYRGKPLFESRYVRVFSPAAAGRSPRHRSLCQNRRNRAGRASSSNPSPRTHLQADIPLS